MTLTLNNQSNLAVPKQQTSIIAQPEFGNGPNVIQTIQELAIRAQAQNLNGFMIRDDYMSAIGDYRTKNTLLWQLIRKVPASYATVKEILRTARPTVDFSNRSDLPGSTPTNDVGALDPDLSDPGQDLKALSGRMKIDHFGRSLAQAQGNPVSARRRISQDTADIISQAYRILEFSLIDGDASAGNGYQFNGFTRQMAANHTYSGSKITGDVVNDLLDQIVIQATTDVNVNRNITHIFCSGAGYRVLQKELKDLQQWNDRNEIVPGVNVPGIITHLGQLPIVMSRYIKDTPADAVAGTPTKVNYWLVDMDLIEWHGLVPFGGTNTFEPQIFDINTTIGGVDYPILDERFLLMYGTLYAKNRGQSIYKLEVEVQDSDIWNTNPE